MAGQIRMSPRLSKAARALLEWQQQDLADASGVPKPTISAFEARGGSAKMSTLNNQAVIAAFEKAGLEIIPENGGGEGLRFRMRRDGTREEH